MFRPAKTEVVFRVSNGWRSPGFAMPFPCRRNWSHWLPNPTKGCTTGSYTAPSINNGRATMKLNFSSAVALDLIAYVLSPNEILVMTSNVFASAGLLSGTLVSQSSMTIDNSLLNARSVYYQLGVSPSAAAAQSFAEIGLLVADGSGGITATYDRTLGGALKKDQTFTATYAVQSGGRVSISGWYGDVTNPSRILYLLDKNKGFFLELSAGVGFGFLEPQSAAPAGGFSNAFLSGTFSASTATPTVSTSPNGCGLVTLDGTGKFTQIANFSTVSGAIVDQSTTGTYTIAADGRGTVASLAVVSAGFGGPVFGVFVLVIVLLSCRKMGRSSSRPGFAVCCFALLIATTPTSCNVTNQLVFYVISPTKTVMFHQATVDRAPAITIIEQ